MRKRLLLFIAAASLLICSAAPALAGENAVTGSETTGAQEAAEASGTETEQTAAEASLEGEVREAAEEAPLNEDVTEKELEEYTEMARRFDMAEILENAETIWRVSQSEEFHALMEYPEMQELLKTVLVKLKDFIFEEPDLAEKVLITLGVKEPLVKEVMLVVRAAAEPMPAE